MSEFLGRLATRISKRWKRSLVVIAAVLAALFALAQLAGGEFADSFSTPGTESQQAVDLLSERFPAQAGDTAEVVFAVEDGTLRRPDREAAISETVAELEAQPNVTGAANPLAGAGSGQVSEDGRIAFVTVQYDETAAELGATPGERLEEVGAAAESAGIEVSRRGAIVDQAEQATAPVGEIIGVALAVIILIIAFRSAAAMAVTLISAGIALAGGLALLTFASAFIDLPSFAPTLGLMLGLGAGIDYALLIVGRYREQLDAGDSPEEAASTANATAGTSVLAAGAIVIVAVSGLLATGIPFVGQMGIGTAIVVATVAVGAVTVLPAMMGAFTRRLRPKDPSHVAPSPRFAGWARRLTQRPKLAAAVGLSILLLMAVPVTALRLGQPDDGNDRDGETTRVAYDRLAEGFGPGLSGPLQLAAAVEPGAEGARAVDRVSEAVARTPGVAAVTPAQFNKPGDAAIVGVIPEGSPQDESTSELLTTLREDVLPAATADGGAQVYVGGATATLDDLSDRIAERLPIFIAAVVGLSILLLIAVFRSIWVPLVSALFNLASIAAAYGVVVAVFQWGWGSELLGVSGEVPIVSFVPLFMFAILFGLSMDYNVFLLSRIREEYLAGAGPDESVIVGVARVGRIIIAAGAIMTAVFLGFVSDPDVVVKTIGLGLASAILIDVAIVRMIVAPAVMSLLGDRAWGLPHWLDRVVPRISLEGPATDSPSS